VSFIILCSYSSLPRVRGSIPAVGCGDCKRPRSRALQIVESGFESRLIMSDAFDCHIFVCAQISFDVSSEKRQALEPACSFTSTETACPDEKSVV